MPQSYRAWDEANAWLVGILNGAFRGVDFLSHSFAAEGSGRI